ncbi:MAG: hypothetical protein IJ485_03435, partial [Lachnospiraceae bacterium]|nr:hypothetical protein [Lachnospiraceae bacterium]
KWECGNGLPEVVYMEPLCQLLGITVNELLAGESIPILELMRSIDMSRLELIKQLEFEQLRMRLYKLYDIEIETMESTENGAGGLAYFVTAGGEKYVVKYLSDNEMNHPDIEIKVCKGTTYPYNEAPCNIQKESAILLAKIHEAMPTGSQGKLAHCRGIRRMHLNSNMSACEQAPVRQFGSSAHGSLLRASV